MTKEHCIQVCKGSTPPESPLLKALWFDYHGHWEDAHQLVDSLGTQEAAWIHAYLHRKEGDPWNAGYWYRRAGKPVATCSLKKEWKTLVENLCNDD